MNSNGSRPELPEEAPQGDAPEVDEPEGVEPPLPVEPGEATSSGEPGDWTAAQEGTRATGAASTGGNLEGADEPEVSASSIPSREASGASEPPEGGDDVGTGTSIGREAAEELAAAAFRALDSEPGVLDPEITPGPDPAEGEGTGVRGRKRGLAGRFKEGLVDLATATYDKRADDLQGRALSAMREAIAQEGDRLAGLVTSGYDARADDLEQRAIRAIRKIVDEEADRMLEMAKETYDARADDLEERAARALRAALIHESRRLQAVIEHSVVVKRKEVRLSLLVLVVANLIYLAVYWITG